MIGQSFANHRDQRGLGLVELMVALALGLLVTGGAIAIFASNQKTYAAAESLGRIQENARIAYELMARDIREAGGTSCANNLSLANVTYKPSQTGQWWQVWGAGIVGYHAGDAGAPAAMKAGSDALQVISAEENPITVVSHDTTNSKFVLNVAPTGYNASDLALVCDYRQASMFQIMANGVAGTSVSYNHSGLNCTRDLSLPVNCASTDNGIQYGNDAVLALVHAAQWYVDANNNLIQLQRQSDGTVKPQVIAEGVTNMTLSYLVSGGADYVSAATVGTSWANVVAVKVSLTLQGGTGQEHVATTGGALTRTLDHIVSIRNHQK